MLRALILLCVVAGACDRAAAGEAQDNKDSPFEAYGYLAPGLEVVMAKRFRNCGIYRRDLAPAIRRLRLRCARSAVASGKPFLFGHTGSVPPDVIWSSAVLRTEDGKLLYISLAYMLGWEFIVGELSNLQIPTTERDGNAPFSGEYQIDSDLYERIGSQITVPD